MLVEERREVGVRPSHTIFEAALLLAHNLGLTPTQIIAFFALRSLGSEREGCRVDREG